MSRMPDRGQTKEIVRMTRWYLMEEVKFLPPIDECLNSIHCLVMNIIVWNCRGASKPSFQSHVRELVHNHDPAIMIIMETRIGVSKLRISLTDFLLMGPFTQTLLGLLVVCGFCGIQTEFRSPLWLCRSKKSMLWLRYFPLILNLFVLLCMLVLDSMRDVFCGII